MADCFLSKSFDLGACKDGIGGVRRFYVANHNKVDWDTAAFDTTGGEFTTLEMLATGDQFYTYNLTKQTSSFTENITVNVENGTVFFEQLFTLVLNTMELAKRNELLLLARANTCIIFELNQELSDDGILPAEPQYWLMGYKNGCDINAGTTASGVAFGDRNGYEVTFQAVEPATVYKVDPLLIPVLTAPKV